MEFPHDHQLLFNPNYDLQVVSSTTAETSCERFPQWTHDETRHLLFIRAQLDKSFSQTKRNKPLWEAISSLLQQRGFHRTPDQCKSKWKNLVTRFKGSETTTLEGENLMSSSRQFPFYEEMRRIFYERMERAQGVAMQGSKEYLVDEEEQEDEEEVVVEGSAKKRKKVVEMGKKVKNNKKNNSIRGDQDEHVQLEGALREFMRRQLEMEARRVEAAEKREAERRKTEVEWRRMMVELREERVQMERRWREREEERRAKEEARADRRHALVVAILGKLIAQSEE